jgi:Pyruvate/2-oxoacid:ferredoxin oxidoreductase gamma subunit
MSGTERALTASAFTLGAVAAVGAIVVMAELNHRSQQRFMRRHHEANLAAWDEQRADDR